MKRFIILLLPLLVSVSANAASHYVRSTSTCSTSCGGSWSSAYKGFGTGAGYANPSSLTRGDTYYVGSGSYAGVRFNTPDSGSSLIIIKGATAADNGSAPDWSNAYSVLASEGGSAAVWTSTVEFDTDYWTFDGNTPVSVWDLTPSHYGFSFGTTLSQGFTFGTSGSVSSNGPAIQYITLSHIYGQATSSDTEKEFIEGNYSAGPHSNVTITYLLLDGWQGLIMSRGQGGQAYSNWNISNNVMLNGFSSSANHGEWIDPNERPMNNFTFAYNLFRGHSGTAGQTGTIVANNSDMNNAAIYGNVFDNLLVGNGVITGTSAGNLNNSVIYNNTFLNTTVATGNPICGSGNGSGNTANNNIIYNMTASQGGGCTFDYNSYFSTSATPGETHGQVASSNPFVNVSGGDYSLATDTTAWKSLSAPYALDPAGTPRTSSRGAYQYHGNSVSAPTNLQVVAVQ
jgi:hypothetical protein